MPAIGVVTGSFGAIDEEATILARYDGDAYSVQAFIGPFIDRVSTTYYESQGDCSYMWLQ